MKKVLILCTGNSCRSIIAETLINRYLNNIKAYSAGVEPKKQIHPNTQKVLERYNIWSENLYSKGLEDVSNIEFDLVVTVCDDAHQKCPSFPRNVRIIHVGFNDPDGKPFEKFIETVEEIKNKLIPIVRKKLS